VKTLKKLIFKNFFFYKVKSSIISILKSFSFKFLLFALKIIFEAFNVLFYCALSNFRILNENIKSKLNCEFEHFIIFFFCENSSFFLFLENLKLKKTT
jgi:hypothetical protein